MVGTSSLAGWAVIWDKGTVQEVFEYVGGRYVHFDNAIHNVLLLRRPHGSKNNEVCSKKAFLPMTREVFLSTPVGAYNSRRDQRRVHVTASCWAFAAGLPFVNIVYRLIVWYWRVLKQRCMQLYGDAALPSARNLLLEDSITNAIVGM